MREIVRSQKKTLVMVTHDPVIAAWADRQLKVVDGRVIEVIYNPDSEIEKRIFSENGSMPFCDVAPNPTLIGEENESVPKKERKK